MAQAVGERPSRADRQEGQHELALVIELDRVRARRAATAARSATHKSCGHVQHVGTCPVCQRVQLARWSSQLAAASR
jgi:hypothetical protein